MPDSVSDPTPEQITELARPAAEASADAYVDGIVDGGLPRADIDPRQAFVDGFLTAIETALTVGAQGGKR